MLCKKELYFPLFSNPDPYKPLCEKFTSDPGKTKSVKGNSHSQNTPIHAKVIDKNDEMIDVLTVQTFYIAFIAVYTSSYYRIPDNGIAIDVDIRNVSNIDVCNDSYF